MSVAEYLENEDRQMNLYIQYGLMAFITLIVFKFLSDSMTAKKNRQMKKNKLLFEAKRLTLMAQMRMAGGGGWTGGGGGS